MKAKKKADSSVVGSSRTGSAPSTKQGKEKNQKPSIVPKAFKAAVEEDDMHNEIHTPHATWLEDAKKHMIDMSPGNIVHGEKQPWPVFSTTPFQLADYGEGIQLYFMFLDMFTILFAVTAVLALPALIWNSVGDALLANGHEGPSDTANRLAKTTIANLGTMVHATVGNVTTSSREVRVNGQNYEIRDITFAMGLLDAISVFMIYFAALWLEYVIIPAVTNFQHSQVVTPDDYTILVQNLPRQIDDHANYASHLRLHFESLLKGQLRWDNLHIGTSVIRTSDKGAQNLPVLRWCNFRYCPKRSNGRDKRGRQLGTIEASGPQSGKVWVLWKYMPALLRAGSAAVIAEKKDSHVETYPVKHGTFADLRDAVLLNQLGDCDCIVDECLDEDVREVPLISSVSLVRDFEGFLPLVRHHIEQFYDTSRCSGRKSGSVSESAGLVDEEGPRQSAKASLRKSAPAISDSDGLEAEAGSEQLSFEEANDDITHLKLKERDVIAAFVTFSYAKHRNFLSGAYRFSRSMFAKSASPQRLEWKNYSLEVRDAVPPSDVYWEDLDYPPWKRALRKLALFLICLLFISFSLGFFAGASQATRWSRQYTANADECELASNLTHCQCVQAGISSILKDEPPGIYDLCSEWLRRRFVASFVSSLASVSVLIVNLATTNIVNRLGTFPKPTSVTEASETVVIILSLAQILNMGLVTLLVNADLQISILGDGVLNLFGNGDYKDLVPAWYANVGGAILLTMCINAIFPLTGAVQVFLFYLQRRRAKEGMTRLQLFALFTPPEFLFAVQHAGILAVTSACMLFSAGMPLLWLLLFVTILGQNVTDRFTFFRGSCKPPSYSAKIMKVIALWLQSICWWHCALAVWSFGTAESVPSYCPRCEGNSRFLILFDAKWWVEDSLGKIEKEIFDTRYVSAFLDHALMASARPNLIVFFFMWCLSFVRFMAWFFGKGIYSTIKRSVELIDDANSALADLAEETKRMSEMADPEDKEAVNLSEVAKDEEAVGTSALPTQQKSAKQLPSQDAKQARRGSRTFTESLTKGISKWQVRPASWKKFLHPAGAAFHAKLFDEPFGGRPKELMLAKGMLTSYDMEDVANEIWAKHAQTVEQQEAYARARTEKTARETNPPTGPTLSSTVYGSVSMKSAKTTESAALLRALDTE